MDTNKTNEFGSSRQTQIHTYVYISAEKSGEEEWFGMYDDMVE